MAKFFSTSLRLSFVSRGVGIVVSAFMFYIAIASGAVVKDSSSAWDNTLFVINSLGSNVASVGFASAGVLILLASLLPWKWILSQCRKTTPERLATLDQPTGNASKTFGELMMSTLKEAEVVSSLINQGLPKEQQLRQPGPKEKRDAAIKLGGLRGAKALIEIEIDCIPTHPSGHESGEWNKWVDRMAALLGTLLKPKFKTAFKKCVDEIRSPDNSRPVVIYHLRGVLNNLSESDLRTAPPAITNAESDRECADMVLCDPCVEDDSTNGKPAARIFLKNRGPVSVGAARVEIVDLAPIEEETPGPNRHRFWPWQLRIKNSENDTEFDLHADCGKCLDVAFLDRQYDRFLFPGGVWEVLKTGRYVLVLCASGQQGKTAFGAYQLWAESGPKLSYFLFTQIQSIASVLGDGHPLAKEYDRKIATSPRAAS